MDDFSANETHDISAMTKLHAQPQPAVVFQGCHSFLGDCWN